MVLGGLRKFSSISATLLLTGGLVWGCTHKAPTVLPTPVNTVPVNSAPINSVPIYQNTNTVTPPPSTVYTENTNQEVAQENTNTVAEETAQPEAEEEMEEEVDPEAQARDIERVSRITQIQRALESYKAAHQSFPEAVEGLREEFLTEIPKDVDGDDFSYTPIGALPAQFYDLCYELEVGTAEITAGYHCASPEGIAHP